ncbi:MAG: 2-succinyl-5-enolpyruvyl-6-hydroxy-3-cyclohexene-1-carboxylic-acid synthase [Chloroflexota bacterium]
MTGDPLATAVRAFVEELVRAGLADVVVCPGSRSTPLALAVAAHPGLRTHVLIDERSAAFVALGLARTARRPVAVLVTSGTAAAELLPAAAEAALARVPLLLLTADRPAELRDRGAPQTIEQPGIFGAHVRWAAEAPLPDGRPDTIAHLRWLAGRAVAEAVAGPRGAGPVHLNLPFREPLVPGGPLGPDPDLAGAPFAPALTGKRTLDVGTLDALAERIAATPRGLLVAGPDDDPALPGAVAALAAAAGWPVVADPLSGVRAGAHDRTHVLARSDQLLRPGPWIDAHHPAIVVRTGAMPTGKPVTELLAAARPATWILDGDAGWREAALVPATYLHADPAATLHALAARLAARGHRPDPAWAAAWRAADGRADAAMRAWLGGLDEPFEALPFAIAPEVLPDDAVLWVGSSMPVRDLDGWLPTSERPLRVLSSRGANGIDGVTSAAVGAALADAGPVLLVTGDVAFLHDIGGLVSARLLGVPLTILAIDNDGGGIFSFLPQAAAERPEVGLPAAFERLFGTPHGIDLAVLAAGTGAAARVADRATLAPLLRDALADRRPGVRVLVLRSDRARNVELHRTVARVAAAALAREDAP